MLILGSSPEGGLNSVRDILTKKPNNFIIMKKKILLGTVVFTLICSYSFADYKDKGISKRAKASFRHEFVNAEGVQWEDWWLFVKASFRMHDQVLSAYFYPEGDLLAVT